MLKTRSEDSLFCSLSYLPRSLADEIMRIGRGRGGGVGEIREISIRAGGRCTMLFGKETIPLLTPVSREDAEEIVARLSDGALYAHRDSIASGYITVEKGIRVGICGYARYEGERLVGVTDMRSLLFRIPGHGCEFSDELISAYRDGVGAGMLIYSAPGVGKTTALRTLAGFAGSGRDAVRVVVVDERCEFSVEDYPTAEVDILKGYKRRRGIEIATRTMSAGLIMIDEIGGDDAETILGVVRCGIPLIATAHASSYEELISKPSLAALLNAGAFDVFVGISRTDCGYELRVDKR